MGRQGHGYWVWVGCLSLGLAGFSGCAKKSESTSSAITLTGDPWVPHVAGVSASNHDASVTVTRTTVATLTGRQIVGLGEGWDGKEITVTFDMTDDLGSGGSLTLVAEGFNTNLPQGGVFPVLTYLFDGTQDLVNATRTGAALDCPQKGVFICSGGNCNNNSGCGVEWPSAFVDRTHWLQHQTNFTFNSYSSTNTFPTCNWTGGTPQSSSDPACAFNGTDFPVKLRSGSTYTARYVLMASDYSLVSSGNTGTLRVSVIKKSKASSSPSGAIDVNVIFVGSSVSQASRNAKGKVNLDTLMTSLQSLLEQSSSNVKLGAIRAFEWLDGEAFANLNSDALGEMVKAAGAQLPSDSDGKAINLFLVDSVADLSTLLGISGGIGGPPVNGLPNSGVVVATFGKLDQYNPLCSAAPCAANQVDSEFADMGATLAHETGHYLGLNHPSEATGTVHDVVQDTPICQATSSSAGNRITIGTCRNIDTNLFPASTGQRCLTACPIYDGVNNFCPAAVECQFNHLMYWSSKFYNETTGQGDGNIISSQSGAIINFHPLIQ